MGRRNCSQVCCDPSQLTEIASAPCSWRAGFSCFSYNWPNNKSRGLHSTLFLSQEGSLTGHFPSAANSTRLSWGEASLFVLEWETGLNIIPVLLTTFERGVGFGLWAVFEMLCGYIHKCECGHSSSAARPVDVPAWLICPFAGWLSQGRVVPARHTPSLNRATTGCNDCSVQSSLTDDRGWRTAVFLYPVSK